MLGVEPTGQRGRMATAEVAETATKPSRVPLQKHSPGGCTIDMPRRTVICGACRLAACYVVGIVVQREGNFSESARTFRRCPVYGVLVDI